MSGLMNDPASFGLSAPLHHVPDRVTGPRERISAGPHQWHVQRTGNGPVCLLLHGTGASLHSWAGVVPRLAEHYTVVTVDLPGHADTRSRPGASLSLESMARDVGTLLDVLQIEPTLVIGHSSGAALVAELALNGQLNQARLVGLAPAILLLDGVPGIVFPPLARLAASMRWLPKLFAHRARDPRQVRRLLDGTGSQLGDDALQAYARLLANPEHVAGVLRMMAEWDLARLDRRLEALKLPILLIAGANDRTVPLRNAYRTAARIPLATLDVFDGLGHLAHEEDPDRIVTRVLAYVAETAPPDPRPNVANERT